MDTAWGIVACGGRGGERGSGSVWWGNGRDEYVCGGTTDAAGTRGRDRGTNPRPSGRDRCTHGGGGNDSGEYGSGVVCHGCPGNGGC